VGTSFDRTLRFVLVTGEEQGLLGSAVYATDALSCRCEHRPVFLKYGHDRLGFRWQPHASHHTRTVNNPSYASDLAIASIFTNVVAAYGMNRQARTVDRRGCHLG